jgi:hypothetical protein
MKKEKRNWIVRMRCEVVKDVCVDNCTEDEARNDPWSFAVSEQEIEQPDWEVKSVDPNE